MRPQNPSEISVKFRDIALDAVCEDGRLWLTNNSIRRALGAGTLSVANSVYRSNPQLFIEAARFENPTAERPSPRRIFSPIGCLLVATLKPRAPHSKEFIEGINAGGLDLPESERTR